MYKLKFQIRQGRRDILTVDPTGYYCIARPAVESVTGEERLGNFTLSEFIYYESNNEGD